MYKSVNIFGNHQHECSWMTRSCRATLHCARHRTTFAHALRSIGVHRFPCNVNRGTLSTSTSTFPIYDEPCTLQQQHIVTPQTHLYRKKNKISNHPAQSPHDDDNSPPRPLPPSLPYGDEARAFQRSSSSSSTSTGASCVELSCMNDWCSSTKYHSSS